MKSIESVSVLPFLMIWIFSGSAAWSEEALRQSHPQASTAPYAPIAWDKNAAAKYLDDRMDLWFEKAKKLRTDQGLTSCVSCHTVVPYAMARPVLRKATGENTPTPQETRLLDEAIRRVDTRANHEPLYKSKDEQSRGTEAVLNLLILAGADGRQGLQAASEPTRKALQHLWKEQRPDGAWDWLDFALEPYESADSVYYGAALGGIAVGTVPGYPGGSDTNAFSHIAKLREYLKENYSGQNLYNRTWMLLASTRLEL
jgi:hypothetical protein